MAKLGIISNPLSHRNRRGLEPIRRIIAGHGEMLHRETGDMAALPGILAEFNAAGVGHVVVNGGDGTIQAVMTALLNRGGDSLPNLAVLAAGRTNLIAHNIGLAGRPPDGLARLVNRHGRGDPLPGISRPVLSLDLGKGDAPVHGMFMGSAAFYRGTMMGRDRFHPLGAAGPAVVGLSLALVTLRALLGRPGGILQGDRMTLIADGERNAAEARDYFLLLATTLDHLILGLTPFWDGDRDSDGALRLTTVAYPPSRLARALLPLARGRPARWMTENGYDSRRLRSLTLACACPIVFDGQIFTPDPDRPVTISSDHSLRFLQC